MRISGILFRFMEGVLGGFIPLETFRNFPRLTSGKVSPGVFFTFKPHGLIREVHCPAIGQEFFGFFAPGADIGIADFGNQFFEDNEGHIFLSFVCLVENFRFMGRAGFPVVFLDSALCAVFQERHIVGILAAVEAIIHAAHGVKFGAGFGLGVVAFWIFTVKHGSVSFFLCFGFGLGCVASRFNLAHDPPLVNEKSKLFSTKG